MTVEVTTLVELMDRRYVEAAGVLVTVQHVSLSLSLSPPPPPRTATVSLIPCRWHNVLVHDLTLTL